MNPPPYRTPRSLSKRHHYVSLNDVGKKTIKHISKAKRKEIYNTLDGWSREAGGNGNKWVREHFMGELLKLQTKTNKILKDLKL